MIIMARNKSNKGDGSNMTKSKIIVIDYKGRAAKRPGKQPVAHSYSPYILNLYADGVTDMPLHPGVNLLDRELFERYASDCTDVKSMVEGGHVAELEELPRISDVIGGDHESGHGGLIARTMRQDGLSWIEDQAAGIRDKEQRAEVLELIGLRRPYARAVEYDSQEFVSHRGIDEADARRRGAAPQPSTVGV